MNASSPSFAHLHCHTEYSILDGAAKCKDVVKAAVDDGQPAIASTNHGNMYDVPVMYKECEEQGIKYIPGEEVYMAFEDRDERPRRKKSITDDSGGEVEGGGKLYYHLTLLAENNVGYKNLIQLSSRAYLEGFYMKPRIDWDLLQQHHEGVIATTGCLGGLVLQALMRGDSEGALKSAGRLQDIFGRDNLFVEIQDHGIDEQRRTMTALLDVAKKLKAPLVATNDSHYVHKEDHLTHDALLCIQTKAKLSDKDRFKFTGEEHYLKSSLEMRNLFSEHPESCDNTLWIADRSNVELDFNTMHLPKFPVPAPYVDDNQYLTELVLRGATKRWGKYTDEVLSRLAYELRVISDMGFSSYFLIMWDLIQFAKKNGIRTGVGRGCLTGDALIWTTSGYKTISSIKVGDMVRTHTGMVRPVQSFFEYDVNEPLITIRTFNDGQGVTMTADHKVLIRRAEYDNGGKFATEISTPLEWVPAGQVKVDDLLCIPRPRQVVVPKLLDAADFIIDDCVTITETHIIEKVRTNRSFHASKRDIERRYRIARNVINTVLSNKEFGPKHIKRVEKSRIRLLNILKGEGFKSLEEWTEYLEEKTYEIVVTPRFISVDEDFCWLLGAWASNGWFRRDSQRVVGFAEQGSTATSVVSDVVRRIWGLGVSSDFHKTQDLVQYVVRSSAIRALLGHLVEGYDYRAQTKRLPTWINGLDPDQRRAMITGLWWGDGCTANGKNGRSSYSTSSPVLLAQVRDLLWQEGLPAGASVDDRTDSRPEWSNRSKGWVITTQNFTGPKMQHGAVDDDYLYVRVRDISNETRQAKVYDLQVEIDHSFMTDSYVVHNSAAGCGVSYALEITDLDPIKYDLLFERFLNPSRVSLPDIDLDMDTRYREAMIDYTAEKYGKDHVAQIVTFSRIRGRSAIRDAARVLEKPYILGDKVAKAMPPMIMGHDTPLYACFEQVEGEEIGYSNAGPLRDMRASDPDVREIIDVALGLEDLRRQDGIHAAAVVIGDAPLTDYLPVQQKWSDGIPGPVTTQYEMHAVEALGLLKMDFLGLRNLDTITDCLDILAREGVIVDIDNLPLDDQLTFDMLRSGDTIGVFQLESQPMQELIRRLQPTSFDDIAALVALYRPGPMAANMHNDYADRKNNKQGVTLFHEDAAEILSETYGLMVYQEQVMQIAQKFAGYSLAEADNLRKAMGKKDRELMGKEKDKFVNGCISEGYTDDLGVNLFKTIQAFADYCFNKSHAYCYGYIAYQTAYLKANYPAEYMAALCSSSDKTERIGFFLAEARARGIIVKLPNINKSDISFTVVDGEILVGLSAIASIGVLIAQKIIRAREGGEFKDVWDFAGRMVKEGVDKTRFANMIDAGAFDNFGYPRLGLAGMSDTILTSVRKDNKKQTEGSMRLFDDSSSRIDIPDFEYPPEERLRLEKKLLGIYVSGHPLDSMQDWVDSEGTCSVEGVQDWPEDRNRGIVAIAGLVSGLETLITRKGDEMARFMIEDKTGAKQVTVFNKSWIPNRHMFPGKDFAALVKCRIAIDHNGDKDLIFVEIIPRPEEPTVPNNGTDFKVYLPEGFQTDERMIARLRGLTLGHRGGSQVILHLNRKAKMRLPDEHRVNSSPELVEGIKKLFADYRSS